jgi:hypothetical protein
MPSLRLNIGLNGGRKLPFGGGAAPSGIPVASTSTIFIVCPSAGVSDNFFKLAPDYWICAVDDVFFIFTGTRWEITQYGEAVAFNTSAGQTVDYIPQTDWNVTTTITVVA